MTWNEMALWYNFTVPPFHPWKMEMKFPVKRVYHGNEKWKLNFEEKCERVYKEMKNGKKRVYEGKREIMQSLGCTQALLAAQTFEIAPR